MTWRATGKPFAKGRTVRREPGNPNKLEQRYAQHLEGQKLLGSVVTFWFDAVKLRLADLTFYSPDFMVLLTNGDLEFHEVKGGFWEDDARVKIKVAASLFPFRFVAVTAKPKKDGGGWKTEEF